MSAADQALLDRMLGPDKAVTYAAAGGIFTCVATKPFRFPMRSIQATTLGHPE